MTPEHEHLLRSVPPLARPHVVELPEGWPPRVDPDTVQGFRISALVGPGHSWKLEWLAHRARCGLWGGSLTLRVSLPTARRETAGGTIVRVEALYTSGLEGAKDEDSLIRGVLCAARIAGWLASDVDSEAVPGTRSDDGR